MYWEQPRYVRFLSRLSRNMRVLVFDKRGIGMSDRVPGRPDLGVLLDDVRAVMDAAGVEKAALLGWGEPGRSSPRSSPRPIRSAPSASPSPAASTIGRSPTTRGETQRRSSTTDLADLTSMAARRRHGSSSGTSYLSGLRDASGDSPPYDDPEFLEWNAKLARYAATPASYEAFVRMWFGTDVRPLLRAISAPTAVLLQLRR